MEQGPALEVSGSRRRIIERPRLTQLLSEAESRVILLVAPAGYGKTTLAREWLSGKDQPYAWYQAGRSSHDIAALALGLADAAISVLPDAGKQVRTRLKTSTNPGSEPESLANDLSEDLASWPDDARFVIDDYHLLAETRAAERFVEALVGATSVSFLIASRNRPSWTTAKKLLYGEVTEFGRTVLAMTHPEAAQALSKGHEALPGLVALAEGWPAVIGLAALLPAPLPPGEGEIPETLHEYFAEELYHGLTEDLRWDVAQLSLAPVINERVARALFDKRSQSVMEEGYTAGFLSKDAQGYDMHPLLRQFLRGKLRELEKEDVAQTARTLGNLYADESRWDEAASVAEEFGLVELMLKVLTEALEPALSEGRLATVNRWVEMTKVAAPTAPVVRFAEIEVAFRTGDWVAARDKATQLAQTIDQDDSLASRVYLRAGQIAHLDDRLQEAVELFNAAEQQANTPTDLRRARWSKFVTLTDLDEREDAEDALSALEKLPPLSVDDLLRASQARLQWALRWGGLAKALEGLPTVLDLVDRSADPIVRTGFLQTYGVALALSARYLESSEIARRQIEEAERFRLDWVLPHALEMRAGAEFGVRDFRTALKTLARVRRLAEAQGNAHTEFNVDVLTARVYLCSGAPERALSLLENREGEATSPGMEGDYLATSGFALACCDRTEDAHRRLDASEAVTTHLESRVLSSFGRAVASAFDHPNGTIDLALLTQACAAAYETGNFDAFVTAYRAFPGLLQALSDANIDTRPFFHLVHKLDSRLAETVGIEAPVQETRASGEGLTPREREVLDLVRQGMSNRQIARTLWIAESTVKVHVHHVLEKLGVRSRTEAVALYVEEN